VFHELNRKLSAVLTKGFLSVDGSKFQANNSKDNNFTANKLDDGSVKSALQEIKGNR
jgi:transposase